MPETTPIYPAAAIHTLDPSRPSAEAVAVSDGRVLAVGTMDELLTIDGAVVDGSLERFTLLPGFVEAHCHTMAGGINNWGHLSVINSTISGNRANYSAGIESLGVLTMTNSTVSGNAAREGG